MVTTMQVIGGPINLNLMHARVGHVKAAIASGEIHINHLRYGPLHLQSYVYLLNCTLKVPH